MCFNDACDNSMKSLEGVLHFTLPFGIIYNANTIASTSAHKTSARVHFFSISKFIVYH